MELLFLGNPKGQGNGRVMWSYPRVIGVKLTTPFGRVYVAVVGDLILWFQLTPDIFSAS